MEKRTVRTKLTPGEQGRFPRNKAKNKPMKYQVNHEHTSGGPKFTSMSGAVGYIRHCMESSDSKVMTISKL